MRKFTKVSGTKINDSDICRVKLMKHIVQVEYLQKESSGFHNIKAIDKDSYIYLPDGEIKAYNHADNRSQSVASLKRSFRKIRDLINNNFFGDDSELHLILTYSENMRDTVRLYSDFDSFNKRLKRRYPGLEYIDVVEPQGRGAWHHHCLLKWDKPLFIPFSELSEIWGHGYVLIRRLNDVDNIGAYLCAYLGDVELDDETLKVAVQQKLAVKDVDVQGQKKRFVKGGRLHLYPPGMNLFRHSRGMRYPEVKKMLYRDVKKIVGSRKPNYSQTIEIREVENQNKIENKLLNRICYENYNIKRD